MSFSPPDAGVPMVSQARSTCASTVNVFPKYLSISGMNGSALEQPALVQRREDLGGRPELDTVTRPHTGASDRSREGDSAITTADRSRSGRTHSPPRGRTSPSQVVRFVVTAPLRAAPSRRASRTAPEEHRLDEHHRRADVQVVPIEHAAGGFLSACSKAVSQKESRSSASRDR